MIMYVLDFDSRSDNGPRLVGPFGTDAAAKRWVTRCMPEGTSYRYDVRPLYVPDGR